MGRILISALTAVLIHGAALFFLPFFPTVPGTVAPKNHGIAIQITHPAPETEAVPSPAPGRPPVSRPEKRQPPEKEQLPEKEQPPEPMPDIKPPPPASTDFEATPDPAEITARKDLMPKKKNLTLSPLQPAPRPPEPDAPGADLSEPDAPAPVNPDPETTDMPSPDNTDPKPRAFPDPVPSDTGTAKAPPAGLTASTDTPAVAGNPDDPDKSPAPGRKDAVPLYKENPPPRYPVNARRRGHAGTVLLMVFVTEKGDARQVRILESSGHESLDQAAERAVAAWRFQPGTANDVPTGMWVKIPITFELKE